MSFSKSQENAISHNLGPMLVLAGPGSGKTTVITHRVQRLIEHWHVDPSKILVISFTRASAVEMKERFLKLMGVPHTLAAFGTFHSVFLTILKQSYPNRKFHIISEKEKRRILSRLIKDRIQEQDSREDREELTDRFLKEISLRKNQVQPSKAPPDFCSEEAFQSVLQGYDAVLKKENQLDFDDILQSCYRLLHNNPSVLSFWQSHFSHILIDEFQDINSVQFETIRLLAAPADNLFVVGDDDQAIYGFRGASPEIMLHFSDYYPEAGQILLDTNYRCHPKIVEASLNLISHNKERYEKAIRAAAVQNPEAPASSVQKKKTENELFEKSENSSQITFHSFESQREEFSYLAASLRQAYKAGQPYSESAVLFRQQSAVEPLLLTLRRENIPFSLKDTVPNIFDHWITKDILAYLSLAYQKSSKGALLQILDKPEKSIFRSDLKAEWNCGDFLSNFYEMDKKRQEQLKSFHQKLTFLSTLPFPLSFPYIRKALGYEGYLHKYAKARDLDFSDFLFVLNALEETGRAAETFPGWLELIEESREKKKAPSGEGVCLMTFHGSKGLEFKNVYLLDVNEGITPHQKAVSEQAAEEERRMFYVAVTRAKEKLRICFTNQYFNKKLAPSRFISELKGDRKSHSPAPFPRQTP